MRIALNSYFFPIRLDTKYSLHSSKPLYLTIDHVVFNTFYYYFFPMPNGLWENFPLATFGILLSTYCDLEHANTNFNTV